MTIQQRIRRYSDTGVCQDAAKRIDELETEVDDLRGTLKGIGELIAAKLAEGDKC